MNPAIGLQLWSVRNSLKNDYIQTLEKIAEIGYQNLELITTSTPAGLSFGQEMPAPHLRAALDKLGLRAVSCHFVPTADLRMEAFLADLQVLGVASLACAIAFFSDENELVAFTNMLNRYGEVCQKHAVQLYYHNHFHEFHVFGAKSIYERLIELLDPDLVKFEFDTYWAIRAGQDPIYWMKKLGKRCDLLHQKDMPGTVSPVNLFEKIGYDAPVSKGSMWDTQNPDFYAEIGEGKLNIAGIIQASRKYNDARFIFVEQDMTRLPELESISVSYANLTRLLALE